VCKDNIAAYGRGNLPHWGSAPASLDSLENRDGYAYVE
jgi:hypothetical protein